ncbi:hypothetical protein QOZ80_3AG0232630 [Eleusine coracana subsp. coracana]|nr:hypothetical protein QOZ80_3AG0232630 [Eleusine coracana subsp. coracana]
MSKWRRYLYLVVDHLQGTYYPLRRIESSNLFFPATQKITTNATVEARLPPPYMSFAPSDFRDTIGTLNFFTMFGRGATKRLIAGADESGFTFMYDVGQRTVHVSDLRLNSPKQDETVSLAVGDALYVMDKCPRPESNNNRCGFEALVFDFEEPEYMAAGLAGLALALPPAAAILGKWMLPFHGRADYIPEYNLWLGFSAENDSTLCALDLNAAKPVVRSVMEEEGTQESEELMLNDSYLVNLGAGKFCVARFFQREYTLTAEKGYESHICTEVERFVVLTGFVAAGLSGPCGKLRMRKHKSRR